MRCSRGCGRLTQNPSGICAICEKFLALDASLQETEGRPRKEYNLTPAALEQRKRAALRPRRKQAPRANNFRHGRAAKSVFTQLKPCSSRCAQYSNRSCPHVEHGMTNIGFICLADEAILSGQDAFLDLSASLLAVLIRVHDANKIAYARKEKADGNKER